MKKLAHLLLTAALLTGVANRITAQNMKDIKLKVQPEVVGDKIVNNLIGRDFGWRYQKVCSFYGALIYADATNNKTFTEQIKKGYQPYLEGKKKYRKGHVDFNVFGIWPLEIYRQTKNEAYFKQGIALADDEYKQPREDGLTSLTRFWVDDMYMVGSLQVQAYKATGDEKYLDRAVHQLVAYCDSLQRPNGLFHHRQDAPYYWGRGNGWGAAAMAEVLQVIPEDHELYPQLISAYKKMMNALKGFQGSDGMWHQLLDDETTFAESSCTGMFLYALITGIDLGILPQEDYAKTIERGWNALSGYVNDKGEVESVVMWTNAKKWRPYYTLRPRFKGDYHGQAAALWAATALVRLLADK